MSAKKNLTVAALAALLAVPAFGATNASHALHIPSVTAHADSEYYGAIHTDTLIHGITINGHYWPAGTPIYGGHGGSQVGKPGYTSGYFGAPGNDGGKNDYMVPNYYVKNVSDNSNNANLGSNNGTNWTNHVGSSIGRALMSKVKSLGGTYDSSNDTENLYYNGHHFELTGTASGVLIDGKSATDAQALAMLDGANSSSDSSQSNSNNNSNGSTQYASKNSLPQTGESNGNSKAMAIGAVALGASASMMALSMAKKHRRESELDSVSSEPTVDDGDSNGDDKSNNNDADDIDAGYHMIMSDMFDNISKDLKQM